MRCTIHRLTNTHAELHTDDGQTLTVPRSELPRDAHEGGAYTLRIAESDGASPADILNEILGSGGPDAP